MVESHKKAYGVKVTSSEKAEKSRYFGISINAVPYPGCEFFKTFKDNKREADKLVYDWSLDFVNSTLSIDSQIRDNKINWEEYKTWNLSKFLNEYFNLIFFLS
jgi:myotubularin-related protein 14